MMPIYQCPKCGKEVEANYTFKKVKCKECKIQMQEIKEQKKIIHKEKEETKYRSPMYIPKREGWQKFLINGKIAWGKRTN
jgi:DNA-directed RNA polymerase subunit RPC12/RpoP